ncbi:uncharacterized protein PpBr36_10730 [Pyricularia pennisetigena]|uniref:uncharacterized protein n=1 Tax=Pyricularia pennisetigena TaxID=1578925 RepID=UPI00114F24C4|nr:uncharacterized protein PpBr36_10730 [Pyricularia pennisetigena]TLS20923.1 hypothetical protein PpBr36_10730 [Pyricularia pennisetigena]
MFGLSGVKFDPAKDIPDQSGRVAFVTGGNGGLGLETVIQLARAGMERIFIGARNEEKALKAIKDVTSQLKSKTTLTFVKMDLTSFDSISRAADQVMSQTGRLHLLINNAGVVGPPPGLTRDGYETQWATNHMGHALFTRLLLPLLLQTAEGGRVDVRVVNVSSISEHMCFWHGCGDMDMFKQAEVRAPLWGTGNFWGYGASKLANILHARMVAHKHPAIKAIAVHPGTVKTPITRSFSQVSPFIGGYVMPFITAMFFVDVSEGAKNQLWAATSDQAASGQYYSPVGRPNWGSGKSKNMKEAERVWDWTEKELDAYLSKTGR